MWCERRWSEDHSAFQIRLGPGPHRCVVRLFVAKSHITGTDFSQRTLKLLGQTVHMWIQLQWKIPSPCLVCCCLCSLVKFLTNIADRSRSAVFLCPPSDLRNIKTVLSQSHLKTLRSQWKIPDEQFVCIWILVFWCCHLPSTAGTQHSNCTAT